MGTVGCYVVGTRVLLFLSSSNRWCLLRGLCWRRSCFVSFFNPPHPPTYEHVKWCSKPLWDCSGRELWMTWSLVSFQQRAFHSLPEMHHLQGKHRLPRSRFMIPQITDLLMMTLSHSHTRTHTHTLNRFSSKLPSVTHIYRSKWNSMNDDLYQSLAT